LPEISAPAFFGRNDYIIHVVGRAPPGRPDVGPVDEKGEAFYTECIREVKRPGAAGDKNLGAADQSRQRFQIGFTSQIYASVKALQTGHVISDYYLQVQIFLNQYRQFTVMFQGPIRRRAARSGMDYRERTLVYIKKVFCFFQAVGSLAQVRFFD
jgi:hypothetical protein